MNLNEPLPGRAKLMLEIYNYNYSVMEKRRKPKKPKKPRGGRPY